MIDDGRNLKTYSDEEIDRLVDRIVAAKPWWCPAYGLAYFVRRWFVTLWAVTVSLMFVSDYAFFLPLIVAALVFDILITPKFVDIKIALRTQVRKIVGRYFENNSGKIKYNKRYGYAFLAYAVVSAVDYYLYHSGFAEKHVVSAVHVFVNVVISAAVVVYFSYKMGFFVYLDKNLNWSKKMGFSGKLDFLYFFSSRLIVQIRYLYFFAMMVLVLGLFVVGYFSTISVILNNEWFAEYILLVPIFFAGHVGGIFMALMFPNVIKSDSIVRFIEREGQAGELLKP